MIGVPYAAIPNDMAEVNCPSHESKRLHHRDFSRQSPARAAGIYRPNVGVTAYLGGRTSGNNTLNGKRHVTGSTASLAERCKDGGWCRQIRPEAATGRSHSIPVVPFLKRPVHAALENVYLPRWGGKREETRKAKVTALRIAPSSNRIGNRRATRSIGHRPEVRGARFSQHCRGVTGSVCCQPLRWGKRKSEKARFR